MKKNNAGFIIFPTLFVLAFLNIVIWLKANSVFGLLSTSLSLLLLAVLLFAADKGVNKEKTSSEADSLAVDSSTRKMMFEFSVPCVVADEDGTVLWFNSAALRIFEKEDISGMNISSLFPGADKVGGKSGEGETNINLMSFEYRFVSCVENGKTLYFITFHDITELKTVSSRCEAIKTVACFLTIDNFQEVMSGVSSNETGKLAIEIETVLSELADVCDGSIQRLERDLYFMILDMEHLSILMAERFSILNDIKKIKGSNEIQVTISIGVGCADDSVSKSVSYARSAMELALGRGGDQAVVKIDDDYRFYGSGSRETEKKTKVRARVMAQALTEIVRNAYQIIIMGHAGMDADSFGAAIGVFTIAESLGVRARIIIDKNDAVIKAEINKFTEYKEYEFAFISEEQAFNIMNDKTVVVLLDTHMAERAQCPELLRFTSRIVVIDHHRKNKDYIRNTILTYHEPYASSTSEMVTEILQYTDNGNKIRRFEAEALYAGIMLDTKNFSVKTGVRTFDAAAFLRKRGVDTTAVRDIFKVGFDEYKERLKIIESAEIYRSITAIACGKSSIQNAAAASDELLEISGIKASFVLCEADGFIHISARSTGEINVQLIAEALGGGGHMVVAGAQIKGASMNEAKKMLLDAIDTYFANSSS